MNMIVHTLHLRISKLLRCFIYEELNGVRPAGKVRFKWLIKHFVDQLDLFPMNQRGKYWESEFWPHGIRKTKAEEGMEATLKAAVLRLKQFVGGQRIISCTEKTWNSYLPLLYRIQQHFKKQRDEWAAAFAAKARECNWEIKEKPVVDNSRRRRRRGRRNGKEKLPEDLRKFCLVDFRSKKLIKSFALLPAFSHQWKHVLIDNDGFCDISGYGASRRKREDKSYADVWDVHCHVKKLVAADDASQSLRKFHGMIRTNGIFVCAVVDKPKASFTEAKGWKGGVRSIGRNSRAGGVEQSEGVAGGDEQSEGVLATTREKLTSISPNALPKLAIVVDGGRDPILTASYFNIQGVDEKGHVKFEPFHLTTSEQRWQFGIQRPWWQRGNISNNNLNPQRLSAQDVKLQRRKSPHAHNFAVSGKYWREITGHEKWAEMRERWQSDEVVAAIQQASSKILKHTTTPKDFEVYLHFRLQHFDTLHEFYGEKRWRRMRLDLYIRRKRAEGELFRRFYPAEVPMSDIVVFWGDGDYSHNMKGSASSPKNAFEELFKNGYCKAGDNRWHRPKLWLPGCEFNTSQRCPECHEQLSQFKRDTKGKSKDFPSTQHKRNLKGKSKEGTKSTKKKSVYRLLVCGNTNQHGPKGKIWERYDDVFVCF